MLPTMIYISVDGITVKTVSLVTSMDVGYAKAIIAELRDNGVVTVEVLDTCELLAAVFEEGSTVREVESRATTNSTLDHVAPAYAEIKESTNTAMWPKRIAKSRKGAVF